MNEIGVSRRPTWLYCRPTHFCCLWQICDNSRPPFFFLANSLHYHRHAVHHRFLRKAPNSEQSRFDFSSSQGHNFAPTPQKKKNTQLSPLSRTADQPCRKLCFGHITVNHFSTILRCKTAISLEISNCLHGGHPCDDFQGDCRSQVGRDSRASAKARFPFERREATDIRERARTHAESSERSLSFHCSIPLEEPPKSKRGRLVGNASSR